MPALDIDFEAPDLQPPVFIATDLTDPPWIPAEMEYTTDASGDNHFKSTFHAEPGEYHYKLRLGPGDWWVCDTTQPIVCDSDGNENNLVVVEADPQPTEQSDSVAPTEDDASTLQHAQGLEGVDVAEVEMVVSSEAGEVDVVRLVDVAQHAQDDKEAGLAEAEVKPIPPKTREVNSKRHVSRKKKAGRSLGPLLIGLGLLATLVAIGIGIVLRLDSERWSTYLS